MKVTDIAFSGYAVTDVKRARKFYEGILGLKPSSVFEADGMAFIEYWIGDNENVLVIGAGAPDMKPGPTGATVTLEVDNFDQAVEILKKNKVTIVMPPQETSVCFMTLIEDPDGNRIMLHKKKTS